MGKDKGGDKKNGRAHVLVFAKKKHQLRGPMKDFGLLETGKEGSVSIKWFSVLSILSFRKGGGVVEGERGPMEKEGLVNFHEKKARILLLTLRREKRRIPRGEDAAAR